MLLKGLKEDRRVGSSWRRGDTDLVELAVGEAHHLGEGVEPGVEDGEEGQDQDQGARQHAGKDAQHHALQRQGLSAEVAEDGHAEALKGVVGVEQARQDLERGQEQWLRRLSWPGHIA